MEQGKPFYQQRWFKIATPVVGVVAIYALMHWNQPKETLAGWMVDALGTVMVFFGTLALASQFVLPVSRPEERWQSVWRILDYVAGQHGPIVFVRDGMLVGSAEELQRKGAGVMLLDAASAAVLEKGREFSRAVGPGITFLEHKERIVATLDLRKQSRSQSTQALTRDGIQVKADVSVTFALDPGSQMSLRDSPDETDFLGRRREMPPFPFNPDSVFKAYYGEAVTEKEAIKWIDLPVIVAAEHFRDLANRFTLDELFEIANEGAAPLKTLQAHLKTVVQSSPHLQSRGIKVYSVSVGMPELPENVMKQRVRSWAARWEQKILQEMGRANADIEELQEEAKAEAKAEILKELRGGLARLSPGNGSPEHGHEIVRELISGMDRIAADPMTSMFLSGDSAQFLAHMKRKWEGLPEESAESGGAETAKEPKIIGGEAADRAVEGVGGEENASEATPKEGDSQP